MTRWWRGFNEAFIMDLSPQIENAVEATLALRKEFTKKKSLLHDDAEVLLQVVLVKTPLVEDGRRCIAQLAHSLAGKNGDVCLFVKNAWPNDHLVRTPDEKIEFSIEHYKKILEEHKIQGISAIMPLRQLRQEYGNYELKRKLSNRFDFFLCELGLLKDSRFTSNIGKFFIKNHKYPIGVKFPKRGEHDRRFPYRVQRALNTTYFDIRRHSDNYSIPVGLTSHTKEQLVENVSAVIKQISHGENTPGGFKNIKALFLKSERSKAAPIYFNLESKNNVPVPHVKSRTPKEEPVEGELSTRPGWRVIVHPNGEVELIKSNRGDDSESEVSDFESEEEEEEEDEAENGMDSDDEVKKKVEKKVKKEKKKKLEKKSEEESESEDEEAENAEQQYLSNWLEETIEEEDKEKKEEVKGNKKQKKQNKAVKRKAEHAENINKTKKLRKEQQNLAKESKGKAGKEQQNANKDKVKAGKVKVNYVEAPKENKKAAQVLKEKKGKNVVKNTKVTSDLEKKGNKRTGLQGKEIKPKQLKKNNVEVKRGKVAKNKKSKA